MSQTAEKSIAEKLIDKTREVAARRPDYIYPKPEKKQGEPTPASCVYVRDGQPSCLIGHAAWELGLIDASFEKKLTANELGVEEFLNRLEIDADNDELAWLEGAQEAQDTETPWGQAINMADYKRQEYVEDYEDDDR